MVLWYWFFIILNIFQGVYCLKNVNITLPEIVAEGDDVTLSCEYDLEYDILYSIRWYFDQQEFYRYTPSKEPHKQIFRIAGINVDLSQSTEHNVVLKSVSRINSANYICEVSTEGPSFHTGITKRSMFVAQLPKTGPVLKVTKILSNSSLPGDTFKASCVSGYSYPTVNFTWTVNGVQHQPKKAKTRRIDDNLYNDEVWSEIIVNVDNEKVDPNNFIIRCETNVFNLYRRFSETKLYNGSIITNTDFDIHSSAITETDFDIHSSVTTETDFDIDSSPTEEYPDVEIEVYASILKAIFYGYKYLLGTIALIIIVILIYREYIRRN